MNCTRHACQLMQRSQVRNRTVVAFIAVLTLAHSASAAGVASSEPGASSFAGAFFFSRSMGPDGAMRMEWFGSILIWLLLLLSVTGVGILSSLAITNGRKVIAPKQQISRISDLVKRGAWKEALALTKNEKSDFSQITHAALAESPQGFSSMVHRAEQVATELVTERLRKIEPLNVIGQVAPMIGLFGTVYGMIIAFGSIVASGGNADPVALAGGIGTALVTTFWGLLVAIPALAGYAFIRNRVDALNAEAESRALELLERFKPSNTSEQNSTSGSEEASTK